MSQLKLYKEFFGFNSVTDIRKGFQKSLVATNRSYSFYVDWKKVKKNIDKIKTELGLLDSLIGSTDLKNDFIKLVKKYPEVVKVLPLLLAIRELSFEVIESFDVQTTDVVALSFKKKHGENIKPNEIAAYWKLIEKSGSSEVFSFIKSFRDYILGVEVGMDTNARKNRSGTAMELILAPLIEQISTDLNLQLYSQKKFRFLEPELGIDFPDLIHNKKFDFLLCKDTKPFNIEVNYFAGAGSKLEIINSYIDRQSKLKRVNGGFALITDGQAWNGNISNELDSGLESLDFVLNLSFVRKGFLNEILKNFYSV